MRNSIRQKENQQFQCQPRLSLKMCQTAKKKPQKNQGRMSMLPLKRERISVAIQTQLSQCKPLSGLKNNSFILNSISNNNFNSSMNQKSIRKQTIINNLVNKLDQEQQIRSIIQTKLRRNSYGPNKQFLYTSEFQPYSTSNSSTLINSSHKNLTQQFIQLSDQSFNESSRIQRIQAENKQPLNKKQKNSKLQQSNASLNSKLKKCQNQLEYFKAIVVQMSKKMKNLQKQSKKSQRQNEANSFYQNESSYRSNKYCNCQHFNNQSRRDSINETLSAFNKKSKHVSIQTSPDFQKQTQTSQSQNYQFDFFENLDRTLKILHNSKQI